MPARAKDDVNRGVDRKISFQEIVRTRNFDTETESPGPRRGKLTAHPSGDIIMPFDTAFDTLEEEPSNGEDGEVHPHIRSDFEKSFTTLMREDSGDYPKRGVKAHPSFGELIPGRNFSNDNIPLPGVEEEDEIDEKSPAGVDSFGNGSANGKKPPTTEFDGKNVMSWQSSGLKRAMIRDQTKMKSAQRMEKMKKEMNQDDLTSFPEVDFADPSFQPQQPPTGRRASVGGYGTSPRKRGDAMRGGSNHSTDWSGSESGPSRPGRAARRASIGSTASSEDGSHYSMQHGHGGRARRRTSIGSQASDVKQGDFARRPANTHTFGGDKSPGRVTNEYGYGDTDATTDYGYGDTGGGGENANTIQSLELYKMVHGKGGAGLGKPSKYQRRASVGHAPSRNQRAGHAFTGQQRTAVWDDKEDSGYRSKEVKSEKKPRRKSSNPLGNALNNSQHSLSGSMHSTHSRSVAPAADPFGVGGETDDDDDVDEFMVRKMVREKMSRDRPRTRKPLYDSDSDSDGSSSDDSFAASDGESDEDATSFTERSGDPTKISETSEKDRKSKRKKKKSDKDKKKRSSSKTRLKKKDDGDDKSKPKKRSSSKTRLTKDDKKKKKDGDDEGKSKKKRGRQKSLKKQESGGEMLDSGQKAANVIRRSASAGALGELDDEELPKPKESRSPGKEGRKHRSKLSSLDSAESEVSSRSLKSEHSKEKEKKKSKKKGS